MISIVVPTRGRPSLVRLLDSVAKARARSMVAGERSDDVEVIVAVDTSQCSVEGVRNLIASVSPPPTIISSGGRGVNLARNQGAEASRGAILWFLDDDVELGETLKIADLNEIFRDEKVVAAGGEYISGPQATWIERGYNALCSTWRASAGHAKAEFLLGGTLAVRRLAWKAVGGFDASIDYGGSETSFTVGLHKSGHWVSFHHELDVVHHPGSRDMFRWWRVASRQSLRKNETAAALPGLSQRVGRTFKYLSGQNVATLVCLFIFGVPFLMVSVLSRVFLVRPAR